MTPKKRLLIIEDDPALLDLMRDYCDDIDCEPILAETGEKGLSLAVSEKPDAITVDHRLPDLSGLTVIQRLKSNPETKHIPVLFLSADAHLHREEAQKLGAHDALLKPLSPIQLRAKLEECLGDW